MVHSFDQNTKEWVANVVGTNEPHAHGRRYREEGEEAQVCASECANEYAGECACDQNTKEWVANIVGTNEPHAHGRRYREGGEEAQVCASECAGECA